MRIVGLVGAMAVCLVQSVAFAGDFNGTGKVEDYEKANAICRDGIALAKDHKYDDAIAKYNEAIAIYPFNDSYFIHGFGI